MKKIKLYIPKNKLDYSFFILLIVLIPVLSIYLTFQEDIFYENLTYIGNQPQHRVLFLLWGTLCSIGFGGAMFYITTFFNHKRMNIICCLFFLLFGLLSLFTPYQKNHSLLDNIHTNSGMISAIFLIIFILHSLKLMYYQYLNLYFISLKFISTVTTFLFVLLFVLGDISGILECLACISLGVYFYYTISSLNNQPVLQ